MTWNWIENMSSTGQGERMARMKLRKTLRYLQFVFSLSCPFTLIVHAALGKKEKKNILNDVWWALSTADPAKWTQAVHHLGQRCTAAAVSIGWNHFYPFKSASKWLTCSDRKCWLGNLKGMLDQCKLTWGAPMFATNGCTVLLSWVLSTA